MFFLSGKGCSEFPKRMLISIGILNLRGSQGKTAVFYREKDQRQEKKQLKKTSHFHHSDEGETSFFMKLVFLPVIAFRGRGITADVFAVDEAVSLYFIVV